MVSIAVLMVNFFLISRHEISICILDALNFTMQRYNTVTVLRLPDCRVNAFGIMQIAQMLTVIGCLRDINLDRNPNVQENYYLLCIPDGNLEYLSLKLCEISDNGVRKIANQLHYQAPPNDSKLIALNLANNHITDTGANHIAEMLRTNRSLQSLDLSGNRIRDEGGCRIIQELKMITLTHEEIVDLRRRRCAELSLREEMMDNNQENDSHKVPDERLKRSSKIRGRRSAKKNSKRFYSDPLIKPREDDFLRESEPEQKKEIIIPEEDKFPLKKESFPMKGSIFACGNFQLQHLNLSFNYLTGKCLSELISCLYYQIYMLLGDTSFGLLYVSVEGNNIKKEEDEDWLKFGELLHVRQNGDDFPDVFQFVPVESETLRENINFK